MVNHTAQHTYPPEHYLLDYDAVEQQVDRLFDALNRRDLPYLKKQVANGADVNAINAEGASLLHCAAALDDTACCLWLLSFGADLLKPHKQFGHTPLIEAIKANATETLPLMLQAIASYAQPQQQLIVALNCAIDHGHQDLAELILHHIEHLEFIAHV